MAVALPVQPDSKGGLAQSVEDSADDLRFQAAIGFGCARIVWESLDYLSITGLSIVALIERFVSFAGFEQAGSLKLGILVQQLDLLELADRGPIVLLVQERLAAHELRAGSGFRLGRGLDRALVCGARFLKARRWLRREGTSTRVVNLGDLGEFRTVH